MAEFEPNKYQKEFLEASNCNLLVSASAGSGKTSTMIQKIIRIISEEKVPINSLLVVTYTNAAASEIKVRLYNELAKLITSTTDVKHKDFLKMQLDNILNTEIGTLHSICKKLITKYFYEINESPDFRLLSDKEQKYLLEMSVNNVFARGIVGDDPELFDLFNSYNSNRNDTRLKNIALQLYNFKVSKTDYIDWKNRFLSNSYCDDLNSNEACNYLLEYYQKYFMSFSSEIVRLKQLQEEKKLDKFANYLNVRYQFINEIVSVKDFTTAVKVLSGYVFPYKPRITEKSPLDESLFDEEMSGFANAFGVAINSFKEDVVFDSAEKIQASLLRAKNNIMKLMKVVEEIEEEYSQLKKKRNSIDFNDLEDIMLKLLENEEVRVLLSFQYKYVFVDEYQDINDKQEKILQQLVSGNNFYMIGDVKQSIYAFRQASPEIFINKYNEYSKKDNKDKVVKFNINYRSDKNILQFANSVFDKIITTGTIGIDYEKDSRFETVKEFEDCNVKLNILNEDSGFEDKEKAEAMIIAEEISKYLSTKKEDGTNYEYGDIAIILRQRGTFIKTLCEVLSSLQIPVRATISTDFFSTSEVSLMLCILQAVSNINNDIAVAVVLKNLFDMTEDELMSIRAYDESKDFYECVLDYKGDIEICNKISHFLDFIEMSKFRLSSMTIRDYLENVVDEFDLINKMKICVGGAEKADNISEFIKISDNPNYNYNVDKFLEYLQIISKDKTLKTIGANNAVEISTIHHSKGLEYPIVILGGLGKRYQLNKDSGDIIINNRFGVGLKSIDNANRTLDDTVVRSACKLENKKSELDEEIRLLYVSMTRAKKKLSLVGSYDLTKIQEIKDKPIYTCKNAFDMIFKSLDKSDTKGFLTKETLMINEGKDNCAFVEIRNSNSAQEDVFKDTNPIVLDAINKELNDAIDKVNSIKLDKSIVTIKNTVTNILKEEQDYENVNFLPEKLDISDRVPSLDVLALGTAYHSVMEEINFNENYLEIENIINSLIVSGEIDQNLKDKIKIAEILKCINILKPMIEGSDKIYKEKQFLLCENYNKLVGFTDNNTKVIVQGVIDLVIEKDNEVMLIDYKTNRGVSETQLSDMYALQLEIYAKAFEKATNLKVNHKFLYSFSLGKLIELK